MPTILKSRRIRVPLSVSGFTRLIDTLTGQELAHWQGNPVRFECAVFAGRDALIDDFSEVQSLTVQIKARASGQDPAPEPSDPSVAEVTIPVSEVDDTVTIQQWTAGSAQHFALALTAAQMNFAAGEYWVVFSSTLTSGAPVTLGTALLTLRNDGTGEPGEPPEFDTYLTLSQMDERYVQLDNFAALLPAPATTEEMEAGTEAGLRSMSPLRAAQGARAQALRTICNLYPLHLVATSADLGSPNFSGASQPIASVTAAGQTPGSAHKGILGFRGTQGQNQVKHLSANWGNGVIDFSRPASYVLSTRYSGALAGHAALVRWFWGKPERAVTQLANVGELTTRSFGIRCTVAGTSLQYDFCSHDGTTLHVYPISGSGLGNAGNNTWRIQNNGDGTGVVWRNGEIAVASVIMPTGTSPERVTTGAEVDITDWQISTTVMVAEMGIIYQG